MPGGHLALHVAQHEIDQRALGESEQVADAGNDDVGYRYNGQRLLGDGGEILEHHQRSGAGVAQLMLELAGGVQRVGVDHRRGPARSAPNITTGYCRMFGSMIATRSPFLQAALLQPGGKACGEPVELGVAQALLHLEVSGARGELTQLCSISALSDEYSLGSISAGVPGGYCLTQNLSIRSPLAGHVRLSSVAARAGAA